MQAIGKKFIKFVPGEMLKQDKKIIFVFSHRINRRVYKDKQRLIGYITFHVKSRAYAFYPEDKVCLGWETTGIISKFLFDLQKNFIEFDSEKGALIPL